MAARKEAAPLPNFSSFIPSWANGLPPEILSEIQKYVGREIPMPGEYGQTGEALTNLLNYSPSNFSFPMEDIQKALDAQQGLQFEQYQKQLRPVMAGQGQLDSTYYANMISDFLKNQQAQKYGTTADLLTQQATQNFDLSKWLPTFKSNVASQIQGLGGAKSNINQWNLEYPFQSYIPAQQGMYNTGLNQAQQQYASAMAQWQADEQNRQKQVSQEAAKWQTLGTLFGPATNLFSPKQYQGDVLAGNFDVVKMMAGLQSGGGGGFDLSGLFSPQPQTSTRYNPQSTNYRSFKNPYTSDPYYRVGG